MSKIFIRIPPTSIEHKEEIASNFDALLEYAKEHRYNLEITTFIFPDFLGANGQEILKDFQQKLHGFKGAISVHGAICDPVRGEDKKVRKAAKQMIFQSLEIVRELKAESVVFHGNFNPPVRGEHYKPNWIANWIERDVIFWSEVLEKDPSIVAFENANEPTPEMFRRVLDEVNSSRLKICLDMGHMNVYSKVPLEEWIAVLGEDIHSMHIHDNKGTDTHTLPGEGTIDWDRFRKVLHGLRYSGNLLLEAGVNNSQFKDHAVFLSQARKAAERLLP